MKFKQFILSAFLISLLGLGIFKPIAGASAQAANEVVVRILPQSVQVAAGQTVDIAVEVADVSNLYAIDVLLGFDPQAVEVVDLDPELDGPQLALGTFLEPGFAIFNLAENELGRARLVMTQLNPAEPKSGTGTIVVLRLRGKKVAAPSTIEILKVVFSNPNGQEIAIDRLQNGQVEVVQSLSGATPTSIPAQSPGTPMPTPVPDTPTATLPPPSATPTQDPLATPSPTLAPTETLPPPSATATQIPASLTEPALSEAEGPTSTAIPPTSTPLPTMTAVSSTTLEPEKITESTGEAGLDSGTVLILVVAVVLIGGAAVGMFILPRMNSPKGK